MKCAQQEMRACEQEEATEKRSHHDKTRPSAEPWATLSQLLIAIRAEPKGNERRVSQVQPSHSFMFLPSAESLPCSPYSVGEFRLVSTMSL